MYFGKWCDLFDEFKKLHNITMKRQIFEQQKPLHYWICDALYAIMHEREKAEDDDNEKN